MAISQNTHAKLYHQILTRNLKTMSSCILFFFFLRSRVFCCLLTNMRLYDLVIIVLYNGNTGLYNSGINLYNGGIVLYSGGIGL